MIDTAAIREMNDGLRPLGLFLGRYLGAWYLTQRDGAILACGKLPAVRRRLARELRRRVREPAAVRRRGQA